MTSLPGPVSARPQRASDAPKPAFKQLEVKIEPFGLDNSPLNIWGVGR